MKRLSALLFCLLAVPAWAQYAPLSLTRSDPPNISSTTITTPGSQTLWNLTTLSSNVSYSSYIANSIQVVDNGANNIFGTSYGRVLEVDFTLNGNGVAIGPRGNTLFKTTINAPTGNNVLPNDTYGTLNATAICNGNDNGVGLTTTTSHGNCSGMNIITILGQQTPATFWYGLGIEFDSVMYFGSSAVVRRGLQIAHSSPSKAIGSQEDYALGIGGQAPQDTFANVTISDTVGDFACTCANIQVGDTIKIAGTNTGTGSISGYVNPTTYYVIATNHVSTFQLGDINTHNPITTTAGSPIGLTFNDTWDSWGWMTGIAMPCGPPCTPDINRAGTIYKAEVAQTVASIFDYHLITCTAMAMQLSTGYSVDCSGNVTANSINATGGPSSLGGGAVTINTGASDFATSINTGAASHNTNIGNSNGGFVQIQGPLISKGGTAFTVASGTGACATTSTLNGGVQAGDFKCTGSTGASTATLTLVAAGAAYTCWGRDITTPTTVTQTGAKSSTSVTLTMTSVAANDVIQFGCLGY